MEKCYEGGHVGYAPILVPDPIRQTRRPLTGVLCDELIRDSSYGTPAIAVTVTVTVPKSLGLTEAARAHLARSQRDSIAISRQGGDDGELCRKPVVVATKPTPTPASFACSIRG